MSSKRKQVCLAVVGSVGLHLIVLFTWAFVVEWFPAARAATSQPPEEIKLQVVEEKPEVPPSPEPETSSQAPTPKPVLVKQVMDAADLADLAHPPKDAAFQSDRNTEAASELPAAGDEPLPTQQGKKVPRFAFDTHPYTPGDDGKAAGQDVPENMPPVPETAPPPPRPVPKPLLQATPTPAPTAAADPRDMAMITPNSIPSTPADAEPNPYDPSFRPPTGMTEPPRPTPVPRAGGYRPQQTRTEAVGNVAKIGAASVASESTPTGMYEALVVRTIDHRWRQLFDARADLVALGTVRVHFAVDRDGKIRTSRVVTNSANEALAAISLRAVSEAVIPPMPYEVAAINEEGRHPMDITFTAEPPAF